MKRRVLHHGEVGCRSAARQRAFQQIVTQHLAVRQPVAEHRMHRRHVKQAFAAEGAFAKQVLVNLGTRCGVGVVAALTGKQPMKKCGVGGRGQGRDNARLDDAVAAADAQAACVQLGTVAGVGGNAHQFAQAAGGKFGVAVECQQVGCVRCHARQLAQVDERLCVVLQCPARQQRHQQFQLAALSFPTYPRAFAVAVLTLTVQHDEACRQALRCGIAQVQFGDQRTSFVQQWRIGFGVLRAGVGPIAEQGKLRMGFGVGQVVQVQTVHHAAYRSRVGEHGGDHHHHAVLGGYAAEQGQTRHVLRLDRFADQAVDDGDHRLRRGQKHQRHVKRPKPRHAAATETRPRCSQRGVVPAQGPHHQAHRAQQQRACVHPQGDALASPTHVAHGLPQPCGASWPTLPAFGPQCAHQLRPARAAQPMMR